jgi:hypothetical protein
MFPRRNRIDAKASATKGEVFMQQSNEKSIEKVGERDGEAGKQCIEGREIYTTRKLVEYVRLGEETAEPPPMEFFSHIQSCDVCAGNWRLVNEPVQQCEKGNETVSPRDLRTYLRSRERGVEMPVDVELHILGCEECRKNWDFIKYSDPELQRFRKERVRQLINAVTQLATSDAYDSGEGISSEDLVKLEKEFTSALSRPRSGWRKMLEEVYPLSQKIPNQLAAYREEAVEKMFGILEAVIKANQIKVAMSIERAFRDVISKLLLNKTLEDSIFKLMVRIRTPGTGTIDLTRLEGAPADLAVLVALSMGLSQTLQQPELLKRSEGSIYFNTDLFQQAVAAGNFSAKSGVL